MMNAYKMFNKSNSPRCVVPALKIKLSECRTYGIHLKAFQTINRICARLSDDPIYSTIVGKYRDGGDSDPDNCANTLDELLTEIEQTCVGEQG